MAATSFKAVIPARYASTRLPAKPLADIAGKPMVVRVMEAAQKSGAEEVWVATDHADVEAAVRDAGGNVLLTRSDHPSGTDRLAEVAQRLGWNSGTLVVNVQGDEPLIDPDLIHAVAEQLAANSTAAIATAAHPITTFEELLNPAAVKVVCSAQGQALYFSRAPIPFARDLFAPGISMLGSTQKSSPQGSCPADMPVQRHVGIYAYRVSFLQAYASLTPSPLEQWEMLEQLRALWHGYSICVKQLTSAPPAGVDTPEDLERVRKVFATMK